MQPLFNFKLYNSGTGLWVAVLSCIMASAYVRYQNVFLKMPGCAKFVHRKMRCQRLNGGLDDQSVNTITDATKV